MKNYEYITLHNTVKYYILLIFTLLFFSNQLYAAPFSGSGSGTAGDPYQITTAAELNEVRNDLNSGVYYKLMNDIDLTSYLSSGGDGYTAWGTSGWMPIGHDGTNTVNFNGNFDGNFKTISGLFIIRGSASYIGLFAVLDSNSNVRNLKIVLSSDGISATDTVGGLAGSSHGVVYNCHVSAASPDTKIIATGYFAGGLTGSNMGDINASSSEVSVQVSGSEGAGGLVGMNGGGNIFNSFATGDVSGQYSIGGLIGASNADSSVSDSYSTGNVTATGIGYYTGGFSGNSQGTITRCYSTGLVTTTYANASYKGAFSGNASVTISSSFFNAETSGITTDPNLGEVTSSTTAQMQAQPTSIYSGWDFSNVWEWKSGSGVYPTLIPVVGWSVAVNQAPTITSTPVTTVDQNSSYSYSLTATDPESDTLTWSVKNGTTLPSWLELNTTTTSSSVTTLVDSGLSLPTCVAVDSNGNLYIADTDNNAIKKRDANGTVTTLIDSNLSTPGCVAVDSSGNLYIADVDNNAIKKRDTSGNVTTLVSGLNGPYGIAVDSSGNLYIADTYNNTIKKRDTNGMVTTLVNSGLSSPYSVAVDSSGNIYIADVDNNAIKKRDTNGNVTTLIDSNLSAPSCVAVDSNGNLYIADMGNGAIKKRDTNGNVTTLVSGLSNPFGVAVDSSGNLYIADTGNNAIKKLSAPTTTTTLAGTPIVAGVYDVNLTVTDGTNTTEQNFQITVNSLNATPTDIALSSDTLEENSATGTTIGTLSATDADNGDTATFSFCGGVNDGNFTIDTATLKSNYSFDYETTTSQSVCIRVTDSGNAIYDKNITISIMNVNDNTPIVTSSPITTVNENVNYTYNLSATDTDNDTLTWSVKNGTTLPSGLTLKAPEFVNVGMAGFSSGTVNYTAMAVDSNGMPYIVFQDSSNSNKATVMKYDGSDWVIVGSAGMGTGQADYISIAIDSTNVPYVAFTDEGNSWKLIVMKLNGNNWETVGTGAISQYDSSQNVIKLDGNNVPYVAYRDGGYYTTIVKKYDGTNWVDVGTNGQPFSSSTSYNTLDINSSGTPYVVYKTNSAIEVKYFDGTNWTIVGNAFGAGSYDPNIAIAGDGTPYVIFKDSSNSQKATVMKYDGSDWVNVGAAGFSNGIVNFHTIVIDSSGVPHVTYKDSSLSSIPVKKFNGTNWVDVGTSPSIQPNYTSIALNSSGMPYIGYKDGSNKASVIKYGASYSIDGSISTPGIYDVNLTVTDGTNTTEQNFQITVNSLNATPTDIALSSDTLEENSATGTTIGTLSVTDIDANDTATFSFCGGVNDGNFTIDTATLKSNYSFDYETTTTQSVCIRVTDSGNATYDKNITISIMNVNEIPSVTSTPTTTVNQDANYSYTLTANDIDGDLLSWSVKNGTTLPSGLTLNSGGLASVGSEHFSNKIDTTTNQSLYMALDNNETPYIAFIDNDNSKKVSVMKLNGTTWENVGNAGFSAGQSTYVSLALDNNNIPYVAYSDYANSQKATVMKFNGTTWENVGYAGFSNGTVETTSIQIDNSGTPYVVYSDRSNSQKATVMKFDGTNWTEVGSTGGLSTAGALSTVLKFNNNIPYVAYTDANFADFNITVMKFNGTTWESVGVPGFTHEGGDAISMDFDSSGTPYIAYRDYLNDEYKATVMKFNGTAWENVGNANFTSGQIDNTTITIDSLDTPYITFTDGSDSYKSAIMKFNGTNWVKVTNTEMGGTGSTVAAINSSNTMYVAYRRNFGMDGVYVTVKSYAPSKLYGIISVPGIYDVNLTVTDGTNTTEQNFQITVNSLNATPTDINLTSSTVSENSVIGTTIGTLSAIDADSQDSATFSFCGGVNDGNFTISGTTLKSNYSFDYETTTSQSVCIRVTDSGNATFDKNISISIDNVVEAVNGTCGNADTQILTIIPTTNLCTTGDATSVIQGGNNYTWSCNGVSTGGETGTDANCSATIATYAVTFNSNGGNSIIAQTKNYNTTASTPTAPTKSGYTFDGWYSDSGFTNSFNFATPITANITLYAKWNVIPVNGTCGSSNNGTFNIAPTTNLCTIGDATTITTNSTTYNWSCTGANSGTTASCSATIATYAVTFNSNGGNSITAQTKNYNTTASTPTAPTKSGYTFGGWYSDSGFTNSFNFATPITANTTLYAKWNAVAVNGTCGSSNNGTFNIAPTTNLCTTGDATTITTNSTTYNWSCTGANSGTNASCSATIQVILDDNQTASPDNNTTTDTNTSENTIVNGTCGTSHGTTAKVAPTTHLCVTGDASSVTTNSGIFQWTCMGNNSGVNIDCNSTQSVADAQNGNNTIISGLSGTTQNTDTNGTTTLNVNTTNENNQTITIKAEMPSNSTGEIKTKHSVTVGGKKTEATSKLEATVDIKSDKSVETRTSKDLSQIVVIAKEDGKAEHTVTLPNNVVSKATSKIVGASTLITTDGNVTTSAGDVNVTENSETYTIKAKVVTDVYGKSKTSFVKVNNSDLTETSLGNTVTPSTPFEAGNNVEIEKIGETLYLKIEAPLSNTNLIIE